MKKVHHQYPKWYHAFYRKKNNIDSDRIRTYQWGFLGSHVNKQHWKELFSISLSYGCTKISGYKSNNISSKKELYLFGTLLIYVEKNCVKKMCVLSMENTDSGYLILVFHCLLKFMTLCMYIIDRHKYSTVSGRDSIVFLIPCVKTSFSSIYIFISIFLIYKCFYFLDSLKQVIISAWFPHELNTILNMYSFYIHEGYNVAFFGKLSLNRYYLV